MLISSLLDVVWSITRPRTGPRGTELKGYVVVEIDPLHRREDFMKMLGVKPTTFDKMLANGELPPPVKVTGNIKAWPASSIAEFIEGRKAAALADETF